MYIKHQCSCATLREHSAAVTLRRPLDLLTVRILGGSLRAVSSHASALLITQASIDPARLDYHWECRNRSGALVASHAQRRDAT